MNQHRGRLMRQTTAEEESSLQCEKKWTPRKGKAARRERDCVIDCSDENACNAQNANYWPDDPKGKK